MASRFLAGASTLALILAACSSGPENSSDSASTHTEIGNGGHATSASAKGGAHAGAAGHASIKPGQSATGGNTAAEAETSDAGAENAGMGGAGGAGGDAGEPPPCDLEGNCSTDGDGVKVTCGIEPWFRCEFEGFVGATAQVGFGERAVIGTACCGACDCVQVEVYFDGTQCWQGIPQCDGGFHKPHATTTPNTSFTARTDVFGTFYIGSGGYGGSADPAGGTAGGSGTGGTVTHGEAGAPDTPAG